jgi:O-antigen/teichoic acid export membrane protein
MALVMAGLVGMLTIFIEVTRTFLDGGFGAALIQKQDATPTDINSIFYFNILVGFAAAGVLCLVAPWIAAFLPAGPDPCAGAVFGRMIILLIRAYTPEEINFKALE